MSGDITLNSLFPDDQAIAEGFVAGEHDGIRLDTRSSLSVCLLILTKINQFQATNSAIAQSTAYILRHSRISVYVTIVVGPFMVVERRKQGILGHRYNLILDISPGAPTLWVVLYIPTPQHSYVSRKRH